MAIRGGILLVLTQIDRIIDIDTENFTAEVEPGVVTAERQRQVDKLGLFYPPDPASEEFSTSGAHIFQMTKRKAYTPRSNNIKKL